ncbi:hypothetical protein LZ30DRAFT_704889 [Colletotrichum cereale]|nr:hypothetical protein LZ30DRAFT_704889 [Colletotrichum cereale]
MKAVAFTTLFIGLLAGVDACAFYFQCHCTDSDGTPNLNATIASCAGPDGDTSNNGPYYTWKDSTDNVTKCYGGRVRKCGGHECVGIDNCVFRELCAKNNATGTDSFCESKVPQ